MFRRSDADKKSRHLINKYEDSTCSEHDMSLDNLHQVRSWPKDWKAT